MKPDDSYLTPEQYLRVRAEAERALKTANAIGCFPTPIDAIMKAAEVEEVQEDVLNEAGFIERLRGQVSQFTGALKSALSKVRGLLDMRGKLVFIDRSLLVVQQTFIRVHEAGHAFMKWQRDLYAIVEDCDMTLEPEMADQFDREANVFASEVIFQLDAFTNEANDYDFGINVPLKLSKNYGASIYASIRRYVSQHHRACAVIVLNKPELIEGDGFRAEVRRVCPSPKFLETFGEMKLPEFITPDHRLGHMVPLGGKRMTGARKIKVADRNGCDNKCVAEAFTQGIQVFILIHAVETLNKTTIIMPGNTV